VSGEAELVVGEVICCARTRLVPVLRLTAHGLGPWSSAEATLVGVLVVPPAGASSFIASTATPPDAVSWSSWLAAQPGLLAAMRERLAAQP
jgi:hypothetical protein